MARHTSSSKTPLLLLTVLLASKVLSKPLHQHLHARQAIVTVMAPPVYVNAPPDNGGGAQAVVTVWETVGGPAPSPDPEPKQNQGQGQNQNQDQGSPPEQKPEVKQQDSQQGDSGQKVKGPDSYSDSNFKTQMLATHNYFRKQHDASALTWNDKLAEESRSWAAGCKFEHSGMPGGGENLAAGTDSVGGAVDGWGLERTKYGYGQGGFSMATGHFTQLVWKGTSSVGCAMKSCGMYLFSSDPR